MILYFTFFTYIVVYNTNFSSKLNLICYEYLKLDNRINFLINLYKAKYNYFHHTFCLKTGRNKHLLLKLFSTLLSFSMKFLPTKISHRDFAALILVRPSSHYPYNKCKVVRPPIAVITCDRFSASLC